MRSLIAALALLVASPASAQVAYFDFTKQFDRFATESVALPPEERVREFRARFNALVPGFYAPRGNATEARYNAHVQKKLEAYPAERDKFLAAARDFDTAYVSANARFRRFFPAYAPTMPIYLLHSLGEMDGGTRELNGKTVAIFGADVIAQMHDATSIGPFLDHELFHFHHARYFSECEQLWCSLWAEGLAVYVAGRMNPGADDKTLMLTIPRPIRPEVEPRLTEAMCLLRTNLDSTDRTVQGSYFFGDGKSAFPPRYGYYLGLVLVEKIARGRSLDALARLSHAQVRPLLDRTLAEYRCR